MCRWPVFQLGGNLFLPSLIHLFHRRERGFPGEGACYIRLSQTTGLEEVQGMQDTRSVDENVLI